MARVHLVPVFLAAILASPLPAQSPEAESAASDEAILVEGQRIPVPDLVRGTINRAGVTPLARFEDRICPGVVGMTADQAAKLLGFIRENIAKLGGKLYPLGCTANASVIFTDEPVDFVRRLAKTEPGYFAFSPRQLDRFTATPRPAVSWHVNEVRDRDGNELGDSRDVGMAKARIHDQPAAAGVPMNARVLRNVAATHLYTNSREDMLFGFVVIDAQRTAGTTLGQLADFATLHLLLDIKQDAGAVSRGSILSLFESRPKGAASPAEFSAVDLAMVEALYRPDENNRSASQQFSQIATAVRRVAEKPRP
jgi:hypothetical protein